MYTMGVPIGIFIDTKGPRPAVIVGAFLLGLGYLPIRQAYDAGSGSMAMLLIVSYLTGLGGCMAFSASVKTSALNWPHHRGTATAFPLAALGLSAFFFSLMGGALFPADTSGFLLTLSVGTFAFTIVGFFFLRVYPRTSPYQAVPTGEQPPRHTSSEEAKHRGGRASATFLDEPGMSPPSSASPHRVDNPAQEVEGTQAKTSSLPSSYHRGDGDGQAVAVDAASAVSGSRAVAAANDEAAENVDETSSLMSAPSSLPGEVPVQSSVDMDRSHRVDIRGWQLLRTAEFWQLWCIMGILSGIGLMTIK